MDLNKEFTPDQLALFLETLIRQVRFGNDDLATEEDREVARSTQTILNHIPNEVFAAAGIRYQTSGKRKFLFDIDINSGNIRLIQGYSPRAFEAFGKTDRVNLRGKTIDFRPIEFKNPTDQKALSQAFSDYERRGPVSQVERDDDGLVTQVTTDEPTGDDIEQPPPRDGSAGGEEKPFDYGLVASDIGVYLTSQTLESGYINSPEDLEVALGDIDEWLDRKLNELGVSRENYLADYELQKQHNAEIFDEDIATLAFELGQTKKVIDFKAQVKAGNIRFDAAQATALRKFNALEEIRGISRGLYSTTKVLARRANQRGETLLSLFGSRPGFLRDVLERREINRFQADISEAKTDSENERRGVNRETAFAQEQADLATERAIDEVERTRKFDTNLADEQFAQDEQELIDANRRRGETLDQNRANFLRTNDAGVTTARSQADQQRQDVTFSNLEQAVADADAQLRQLIDNQIKLAASQERPITMEQILALPVVAAAEAKLRQTQSNFVNYRRGQSRPFDAAPPTAGSGQLPPGRQPVGQQPNRVAPPSSSLPTVRTTPGTDRAARLEQTRQGNTRDTRTGTTFSRGTTQAERLQAERDVFLFRQGYTEDQINADPEIIRLRRQAKAEREARRRGNKQKLDTNVVDL